MDRLTIAMLHLWLWPVRHASQHGRGEIQRSLNTLPRSNMASNNIPHRRESRARRMVKRLRDRSEISPFYKYVLFFTNFLFLVSCTCVVTKGVLNMKCHTHELNLTKITFLEIFLYQLHLLAEFYLCSAIRCVEVSHSCIDFHQDKFDRFFFSVKQFFSF